MGCLPVIWHNLCQQLHENEKGHKGLNSRIVDPKRPMPILWKLGVAWPYRKRWQAKAGLDVMVWVPCWIYGCPSAFRSTMFILFLKFFEDIGPFCGTTDTPVLDFWQQLPLVSKPGWILLLACFVACTVWNIFLRFTSGVTPASLKWLTLSCSQYSFANSLKINWFCFWFKCLLVFFSF